MININLERQNHKAPEMNKVNAMRKQLEELISSDVEINDLVDNGIISQILNFQNKDGSFNLLDSYRIESDCRIAYCHEPTYICTAILMKTLLENKEVFNGRENEILSRAMHMCCARQLVGSGFSRIKSYIKVIDYFIKCDVRKFLEKYSDMCPEFTLMFRNIATEFYDRVENKIFICDFSENYEDDIRRICDYFSSTNIFVYGTLMKGQYNHDSYLDNAEFMGNAELSNYEMYDLGSYPGIVAGYGNVVGEVYHVSADELKKIDLLEGEGLLYDRKLINPIIGDERIYACVYIYKGKVEGCKKISGRYQGKTDHIQG